MSRGVADGDGSGSGDVRAEELAASLDRDELVDGAEDVRGPEVDGEGVAEGVGEPGVTSNGPPAGTCGGPGLLARA